MNKRPYKLPSLRGVKDVNSLVALKKQWYDLNFAFNLNDNTVKALTLPSKTLGASKSSYLPRKGAGKDAS